MPAVWAQTQGGSAVSGEVPLGENLQSLAPYQVSGLSIDATADNAANAREKAIKEGQVRALQQVLQRLVTSSDPTKVPTLSAADVEQMVLGLSLRDEKTSTVRYLAKMDVSFMPQAVKNLLDTAGVSYVQGAPRPLIVLPVWQDGASAQPVLWEDPNPWRWTWALRKPGALVTTEVPLGDLSDVSLIDVEQALAVDEPSLAAITHHYGVEGAMVVSAVAERMPDFSGEETGEETPQVFPSQSLPYLHITVHPPAPWDVLPLTLTVEPHGDETMDALLSRAVMQTGQVIDRAWKRHVLTYAGPVSESVMLASFDTLEDWLAIGRGLSRSPAVRSWHIIRLQRHSAYVSLSYGGPPEALGVALSSAGIALTLNEGGWTLTRGPIPALDSAVLTDGPLQKETILIQ